MMGGSSQVATATMTEVGKFRSANLDQLQAAHDHVSVLAALASGLVEPGNGTGAQRVNGARCACNREVCVLSGAPGGSRACILAGDLARLPGVVTAQAEPADLAVQYLTALKNAAPAVFTCRRLLHPGESCAFRASDVPRDVCARVLALAHLINRAASVR